MESYDDERNESYLQKRRESKANHRGNRLQGKMADFVKIKEQLKRAKDEAMQAWLDSKPLIDELERLKSDLAVAQNRSSTSDNVIAELESELDTINKSIRSKREEEQNTKRTINEISPDLDQTRQDLETLKLLTDEERRAKSKLKQKLRLRKQTLRQLQLTVRAVRIASEAFGASTAEALHHIEVSETDSTTVQLTHEEYFQLTKRAEEETSLGQWRISVSMEQKLAAEASRNTALSRLNESYSYKKRKMEEKIHGDGQTIRETEEHRLSTKEEAEANRGLAFPKARAELIGTPQRMRRTRINNQRKLIKRRKTSIFHQIRGFLVRSITIFFR